jgi:asparagine synthase (glutamine-hydrolysing)
MLTAMAHRGPDGRGTMDFIRGAAGMVRLALVDPTERGQQPMWSPDGRVAILFNGEIYNFREERKRLEQLGHQFRSTTDTEVALHLFLEHGTSFVSHLRGMFAIALFDWRDRGKEAPPKLVLVRGHFGIKPFYIAQCQGNPNSVIFSSEIRAMLASRLVPRNVNREALAEYLATGFVWQPRTIIDGVRMLEPGTLEVHEPGKARVVERFWQMPPSNPKNESLDAAAERLRHALDESIRLHAMADVPIGAFLSGGVDSTAIVGLMRKQVSDLRTYTLRFPEFAAEDADESAQAAEAAQFLQVRNTVVDVTGGQLATDLPKFARDLDQPSNDGINTWLISRAAASDVKGVLSGLGGDEWFAGYHVTRRMSRYSNTSLGWTQTIAAQIASAIVDLTPPGYLRRRVANLAARRSPLSTWIHSHSVFDWREAQKYVGLKQRDLTLEPHVDAALSQLRSDWKGESIVGLSFLLDSRIYMINQLLRDSDATSMAHSLELRVPFVDIDIVGFTRTCLDEHKLLRGGGMGTDYMRSGSKRVLIHAIRDVLPLSVANRPKRGFVVPTHRWMETSLAPLVEETCNPETVARRGLIDPKLVAPAWSQYKGPGKAGSYDMMWTLMILELWCRGVIDESPMPAPHVYSNALQ